MYIVGIDIAKRFHEAAIINQVGKIIVKRIRFANSHTGFLKLMDAVKKLDAPAEFGMENRALLVAALCSPASSRTVHVINPLQSDALRSMFIRQTKNDTQDALIVVEMASDFKCKIIALLDQTFHEYEKLFSDTFGKSSVELLANYTTPEEMLAVDAQTLADLLNKVSRGRFGLDKANQIQQTAKNSFGIVLASSSFSLIIRQYLEQLKSFESSIKIFDEEIARIMDNFDTKLETITGAGTTLAVLSLPRITKSPDTISFLAPSFKYFINHFPFFLVIFGFDYSFMNSLHNGTSLQLPSSFASIVRLYRKYVYNVDIFSVVYILIYYVFIVR